MGTPGRRRTQHYALKDAKQAIRYLKIPLVAGQMECNQNVIRKSPPLVVHGSLRSISGGAGTTHVVPLARSHRARTVSPGRKDSIALLIA